MKPVNMATGTHRCLFLPQRNKRGLTGSERVLKSSMKVSSSIDLQILKVEGMRRGWGGYVWPSLGIYPLLPLAR